MKLNNSIIFSLSAIFIATAASLPDEIEIERYVKASLNQRQQPGLRIANVAVGKVNTKVGQEKDAKLLFNAMGLSYCPKSKILASSGTYSRNLSKGFKVLRIFENKGLQTLSYLAEITRKKQLIMSFRGSVNQKNWELNLDTDLVQLDGRKKILVHRGFKTIANSMAPAAISYMKALFNSNKYRDYTLVVTGHSLGGAVATLSAMKYKEALQLPWNRIRLLTIGSPRVGNQRFANWVNSKPMVSTRVVNENDPVPKLLGGDYRHIQTEMYIKNGKSIICRTTTFEDKTCSASTDLVIDGKIHKTAWGFTLGQQSC